MILRSTAVDKMVVVLVLVVSLLLAQIAQADTPPPWLTGPGSQHMESFGRGSEYPSYPQRAGVRSAPSSWSLAAARPEGVDLDVTYINRSPMYHAYAVLYPGGKPILRPGTEDERRWPSAGEIVTFTAHIVNKGSVRSPSFDFKWFIDGVEVASGTHPGLDPGAEGTATYQWPWAHTMDGERVVDDHAVRFVVDPDNLIAETYKSNNSLEDRTNALGFSIAITPVMVQAYDVPWDPRFPFSAENWLQRQIAAMNWAFANSIYPVTQHGTTERVRINEIIVTHTAPWNDGSSDGGWFVDADYRIYSSGYDPATDIDWNLVHELSHQVGLIDLYQLNIGSDSVGVLDRDGFPVNFGFYWPRWGLMGGGDIAPHTNHHLYSSHSAGAISSSKGYRRGYYGEYQYDIPQENYILILDNQGQPAAGAQVGLYQRGSDGTIDNDPEITGVTGADGRLLLTNRPVGGSLLTRTGHTLRDNPFGVVDVVGNRNRFLARLVRGLHEEFAWLDITSFNLAYWQGHTASHEMTITSHVPPMSGPTPPEQLLATIEGDRVALQWQASSSPDVIGYRVYRAAPPEYSYQRIGDMIDSLSFVDPWGSGGRVYTATAIDSLGRESGFSSAVWAPTLVNPSTIGILADGNRVILDPQNGYALLQQHPNGRYIRNIGSVHYHLEHSRFLAVDSEDRLLISHPGDYYSSRHSVRVADRDATPLFEFGENGSGPGQFNNPAGVASWGSPCSYEGPYDLDGHTLLLLHLDGDYDGAGGEQGEAIGVGFAGGRYGQGAVFTGNSRLIFPTTGNLDRGEGAIEFWIRPNWDGDDGQGYTFFEAGDTWFNRMRIAKDGANNLRFLVWDSATESGVSYNVAHWRAGEWHHVAVNWEGTSIAIFVDGQERDRSLTARLPDVLAATMTLGSSSGRNEPADATVDEFRISAIPRVGNNDICRYRILVADSGNHRIQAFDARGNFVSAYGSFGNGSGQFSSPQGLAVNSSGNVVVADSSNNRLQVLSFDGTSFGFVRNITAGFNGPTSVATYGNARIIVADTGNNKVKVLDAVTGNLLAEYGAPNDGRIGAFNQPRGVIADKSARIVVADTGNKRVVTLLNALPVWAVMDVAITGPTTGVTQGDYTFSATVNPITATWHVTYSWEATGQPSVINTKGISDTVTFSWSTLGTKSIMVKATNAGGTVNNTHIITVEEEYVLYLPIVLRTY